jgi:ATP-binding cassette, subfamily G (WHITE), member 2, PDR
MYRVSPLTYIIGGVTGTGVTGKQVHCSSSELNIFNPPSGQTCGQYLKAYLAKAPGQLLNPSAASDCKYCPFTTSDQVLSVSGVTWATRWRDFGIVWAYIAFNVVMTLVLYYAFRVKKWKFAPRKKGWGKLGVWCTIIGKIAEMLVLSTVGRLFYG